MKSAKEIADLIYSDPDSYESVVRAIHLPIRKFLYWVRNTRFGVSIVYRTMGLLEIPLMDVDEFHDHIHKHKAEILQHFKEKFHISN